MTTTDWCLLTVVAHIGIWVFVRGFVRIDRWYATSRMRSSRTYMRAAMRYRDEGDKAFERAKAQGAKTMSDLHAELDRFFPGQRREVRKDPPS